jgi:hypothetical protein
MLLKRLAFLPCVLAVGFASSARQTSTTVTQDPQAIVVLQRSISTMGSSLPSDSVATGSVQTVAGSQASLGTIQILTKGSAESLVQMTMPDATRTTIYANGQANELVGATVTISTLELAVTSQAPYFPIPLFAAMLSDPDYSFEYVALESSNGVSLHHIRTWDSYATQPGLQSLSSLSTRDIWIDANSSLPQRISYVSRPARGAVAGTTVDVFLSNYQNSSGVLYPSSIQKSLNGTPWASISIQSVSFNTGLSDSSFPIQ